MKFQTISLAALAPTLASSFTLTFKNSLATTRRVTSTFTLYAAAESEENTPDGASGSSSDSDPSAVQVLDVSDLGLTMADLQKPIPIHDFSLESSGYQSTSRIPTVDDEGCYWVENPNDLDVTLRIPGLRGQPAACLSVLFSTTTISITAFGRVVWSCIQMGISDPDDCSFLTEDGEGMVPIVQLNIKKRDEGERWGGYILQVGEDSIL